MPGRVLSAVSVFVTFVTLLCNSDILSGNLAKQEAIPPQWHEILQDGEDCRNGAIKTENADLNRDAE